MSDPVFPRPFNDEKFPERLLEYVRANATEGDPKSVLDTIDTYCWTVESGMNVGDKKGAILDEIVKERAPKLLLEFGTFCGYSAIRTAAACLPDNVKLYSLEINPYHAGIARQIIAFAGVDKIITVLEGDSSKTLHALKTEHKIVAFDFVFIDHWKKLYLPDFKTLEALELIGPGSVCVADNCIWPGCPDFLEFVRDNPRYETTSFKSYLEYHDTEDAIEKVVVK